MSLDAYYSARAKAYENVYTEVDATRRSELNQIRNILSDLFAGHTVLEVACGTGYWTRALAAKAAQVVAIDASTAMLEVAQSQLVASTTVTFYHADAYHLDAVPGTFSGGMANFWLSHVPKSRLHAFLTQFHRRLEPKATVMLADNVYIPGVGGDLITKPADDNTYKRRQCDGRVYEVLKNYYTSEDLRALFEPYADHLTIRMGYGYWWLWYTVKPF